MIWGHWFTVSMYSALQGCHIRCIYRLKLCRQDMLELLRGTVSSRRSFIQQQHSFISTVGRSITFAYRIVASHLNTQNSHARLKYDLRHALIMEETHLFDFNIHLYLKLSTKCSNIKLTSMKISDLSVNSQKTLKWLFTVDCQ